MARPLTGQFIEKQGKRGRVFGVRFYAGGRRHYVTLAAKTRADAEVEMADHMTDVRRGIWRPVEPLNESLEKPEPTFHAFASEWLEARRPELGERTYDDYRWALTHHLLPWFKDHRLSEITVREVDRYKAAKLVEGVLSPNTINKTLTRLSQILALAAEYDLIPANRAAGKRRR
jgi:Phage integrase, N-terminal SAM-like domain